MKAILLFIVIIGLLLPIAILLWKMLIDEFKGK
jgi:hypothetical protein